MNIQAMDIPTVLIQLFTAEQAWHYQAIPYTREGQHLVVLATETGMEEELSLVTGLEVTLSIIEVADLKWLLAQHYRKPDARLEGGVALQRLDPQQDFLSALIDEARNLRSSDIHFEPFEHHCRIRMRVDGNLIERYVLERETYPALVNKVKIRANMDIAEKRLPQDGRIFFEGNGRRFDLRVSVLATLHGEKMVMRLLSGSETSIDLDSLGFGAAEQERYLEGIRRPNGMVLISGPTGSGKTTTLYATLKLLNKTERNVLTIEDPIEYTLEGINQVQLRENIGLNFASALRTFLRQDPDVIMVGEIRDVETASMAIRASLTGHLVLSTIHTNSAWGIVSRLIDMGVPGYLLADTLNVAAAQRLVRLLCPYCKYRVSATREMFPRNFTFPVPSEFVYEASGCEHCFFTGYKGRKGVYEVIAMDTFLSDQIKFQELNVKNHLNEIGVKSLAFNAFELLVSGETSVGEIYPMLMA